MELVATISTLSIIYQESNARFGLTELAKSTGQKLRVQGHLLVIIRAVGSDKSRSDRRRLKVFCGGFRDLEGVRQHLTVALV